MAKVKVACYMLYGPSLYEPGCCCWKGTMDIEWDYEYNEPLEYVRCPECKRKLEDHSHYELEEADG